MAPFLFVQKSIRGAEKMVSFPFLGIIKSYYERKKENYKIHAFAK